jgi:hypothetical protein
MVLLGFRAGHGGKVHDSAGKVFDLPHRAIEKARGQPFVHFAPRYSRLAYTKVAARCWFAIVHLLYHEEKHDVFGDRFRPSLQIRGAAVHDLHYGKRTFVHVSVPIGVPLGQGRRRARPRQRTRHRHRRVCDVATRIGAAGPIGARPGRPSPGED